MIMLQNTSFIMNNNTNNIRTSQRQHKYSHRRLSLRAGGRFPVKLRTVLNDAIIEGNEQIISWVSNGAAFKIHKPDMFVKLLMQRYFRQTHFRSFTRQVRERKEKDHSAVMPQGRFDEKSTHKPHRCGIST